MSVIGFAIAVALIIAIWVPLATHGREAAGRNQTNFNSIDTSVGAMASPIH